MEEKNKSMENGEQQNLFRRPWLTVRCEDMFFPMEIISPNIIFLNIPTANTIAITKEAQICICPCQYRPGIGRTCYELCAGVCEKEDAVIGIRPTRIMEETGY